MSLAACRIPYGRGESKCFQLLIFTRSHLHCAWNCSLHHALDTPLPSAASAPLQRLDTTGHHLSPVGDADRPCQKHVRTGGRKRLPPAATDHSPPARETTCLYHNGSAALGTPGKSRSDLETRAVHCSARRRSCAGIARDSSCTGTTHRERLLPNQKSLQRSWR
jgi:hypothetical protein